MSVKDWINVENVFYIMVEELREKFGLLLIFFDGIGEILSLKDSFFVKIGYWLKCCSLLWFCGRKL